MRIVGIDLSGPRNTADTYLVSFEERANEIHLIESLQGADDAQILASVSRLAGERIVIGIDAPLSYNIRGGDRPSDSELRRIVNQSGRGVGIMPPTMNRMVYLTLRGVALTRMLETLKPGLDIEMAEVHPGACMLLRDAPGTDVASFKRDIDARFHLLEWLETKGLKGLPRAEDIADHFVAACAAALGAWQWSLGKSIWCSPAKPPEHPYDFAV